MSMMRRKVFYHLSAGKDKSYLVLRDKLGIKKLKADFSRSIEVPLLLQIILPIF